MRSWAAVRARVQVQWANEARRAAKTAELRAHTVPQLRALCAEHGLHKAGVKAALVARLCDALCADEPAAKRPRTEVCTARLLRSASCDGGSARGCAASCGSAICRGCTCGCSPDAEQCIRRSGNRRSEPRFDLGLAEARPSWLVLPALGGALGPGWDCGARPSALGERLCDRDCEWRRVSLSSASLLARECEPACGVRQSAWQRLRV